MGSRYDLIKQIESNTIFISLIKKGLLPTTILDRKVYYEFYLNQRKQYNNSQSIYNTAEEYRVSERTIRRAVKFMAS